MTAAIVNPYWDTMGGGERYTASFIKLLLDLDWEVSIQWSADISQQVLARFGLDISRAKFVKQVSPSDYSLLFWVSDGSLPTSYAKKTIIHFQFPFQGVNGGSLSNKIKSMFYIFVVNSNFTKAVIDQEFNISSKVIYPPVDTSAFTSGKKENTIFYLGRFSNLTQQKGQTFLVQAFQSIYSKIPNWKLVLAGGLGVGTGPNDLDQLRSEARNLPIEFMLNPSFSDIKKLCARSKIFWSASGYQADAAKLMQLEHFGITVVEAMAAGCVPIVTNLGGHKEIIDFGLNGYLWDDPNQLQHLTLDLVANKSQLTKLARNAIQKSKIFDISNFNAQFRAIL